MEALLNGTDNLVFLLDGDGQVLWANESGTGLIGKSVFALVKPEGIDPGAWDAGFLAQTLESVTLRAAVHLWKDSREAMLSPLAGNGAKRYLLAVRRAREGREARHEQPAAKCDPLTGLYGYSQFHSLLKYFAGLAVKNRIALGIIFCDI